MDWAQVGLSLPAKDIKCPNHWATVPHCHPCYDSVARFLMYICQMNVVICDWYCFVGCSDICSTDGRWQPGPKRWFFGTCTDRLLGEKISANFHSRLSDHTARWRTLCCKYCIEICVLKSWVRRCTFKFYKFIWKIITAQNGLHFVWISPHIRLKLWTVWHFFLCLLAWHAGCSLRSNISPETSEWVLWSRDIFTVFWNSEFFVNK